MFSLHFSHYLLAGSSLGRGLCMECVLHQIMIIFLFIRSCWCLNDILISLESAEGNLCFKHLPGTFRSHEIKGWIFIFGLIWSKMTWFMQIFDLVAFIFVSFLMKNHLDCADLNVLFTLDPFLKKLLGGFAVFSAGLFSSFINYCLLLLIISVFQNLFFGSGSHLSPSCPWAAHNCEASRKTPRLTKSNINHWLMSCFCCHSWIL